MSSLLTPGERPSEQTSLGDVFRRVMRLEAVPAGGGSGGGITAITSADGSIAVTNPTGPTVDLSVDGFIQFDTNPQSGGYLAIQTTGAGAPHSAGIAFDTKNGVWIEADGSVNNISALNVRNIAGSQTTVRGVFARATSTSASNGSSTGVVASAHHTRGNVYGLDADADTGNSSASTNEATAVRGGATTGSGAGKIFGGAFDATTTFSGGACPFAIGVRGTTQNPVAADPTVLVGGWFGATTRTLLSPLTGMLQSAERVNGVVGFAQSINDNCAGLILDVYSSGGTAYLIRAYVRATATGAGAEVFRVDAGGNVHIKTGANVIADL